MSRGAGSRPSRIWLLLWVCTVVTGCFTTQSGPPPVNLSQQTQEIDATIKRVGGIGTDLTDQVAQFRALHDDLLGSDEYRTLFGKPYPIHLFKHTAIACLNEPVDSEPEPGTPAFEAAEAAGIQCVVVPLPVLLERVRRELPRRYEQTVTALVIVDQLRTLRAQTSAELRDVPRLVDQTRNFIAARRAELRRIEIDVERNRPEFTGDHYDLSKKRVRAYRKKLDELEVELKRVERTEAAWSIALGNAIRDLYKGITKI